MVLFHKISHSSLSWSWYVLQYIFICFIFAVHICKKAFQRNFHVGKCIKVIFSGKEKSSSKLIYKIPEKYLFFGLLIFTHENSIWRCENSVLICFKLNACCHQRRSLIIHHGFIFRLKIKITLEAIRQTVSLTGFLLIRERTTRR